MKITIGVGCAMILAMPTLAIDLGTHGAPKLPSVAAPNVPVAPRQGGDTIATAVPIPSIPVVITGTTTGFTNDYDGMCPFDSLCPDVVYVYRPAVN